MMLKYAPGQKVRFNKRCVLAPTVPKNSSGYECAVLVSKEGDPYTGAGVIEKGAEAVLVDYASHGTATTDVPILLVHGRRARCHPMHLDAV